MKEKKNEEAPIVNLDRETFKDKFKALYGEMYGANAIDPLPVSSAPDNASEPTQEKEIDPFSNYNPTVKDFIRRANTISEALEILDFLEKRGELTSEETERLKSQLHSEGLEFFGPKKRIGEYFIVARELQTQNILSKHKKEKTK